MQTNPQLGGGSLGAALQEIATPLGGSRIGIIRLGECELVWFGST